MTGRGTDDDVGGYASPPCYMHEVDPAYMGLVAADPRQRTDVRRWRTAERARLVAARLAIPADARRWHEARIAAALDRVIGDAAGLTVGAYWPVRGEPDLRAFFARLVSRGGRIALPAVIGRGRPLVYRLWVPGAPLQRGIGDIPVPADGAATVLPDVILAPVVGFDPACHRLGYGGGYFDRTLAAMPARPRAFGVGYALAAVPTIYPQPHDVPLDAVLTEGGVTTAGTLGTSGA